MRPHEIIQAALAFRKRTPSSVSLSIGRAHNYVTKIVSRKSSPSCETMALILNELDFKLVARSFDGGIEFAISMPEKDKRQQGD